MYLKSLDLLSKGTEESAVSDHVKKVKEGLVLLSFSHKWDASFIFFSRFIMNSVLSSPLTRLCSCAHLFPGVVVGGGRTEKKFAFVCCGNWDVSTQIPKQCKISGLQVPRYMNEWINIKDVFNRVYLSRTKVSGMKGMLRRMGMLDEAGNVEGVHHLGMHDTENITRILLRLIEEGVSVDITGKR